MVRLLFILEFLLFSNFVFSQDMTLRQCIDYATEHNLNLSDMRINTEIAKENHRQSKRDILPRVSSGINGNQVFGRSIDPNTNTYISEGSIYSANMYIAAEMVIFEGFAKKNTIDYNKLQYLMSKENFNQLQMELEFKIMNSFYDIIYYDKLLDIADEQVKLTELNLKKVEKLISLGLKAESDLLEMKAQAAAEIHNRISIKNQKEKALFNLKKLMNYPVNEQFNIAQPIIYDFDYNISADSVYEVANTQMPLLKKTAFNIEVVKKQLAISKGRLYPTLVFGSSISSSYTDSWKEAINPKNTDLGYRTVDFDRQFSDNMSKRIYLQLNIPIFNRWQRCSHIKKAKLNLEIAKNEYETAKLTLRQDIAENYRLATALKEEQKQLEVKKQAMQKAYQIAERKMQQGLINILEFYSAKNQLANTEAELLKTKLLLIVKQKTFDFYMGKEME